MPDPFIEQAISLIEKAQEVLNQVIPSDGSVPFGRSKSKGYQPPRYRTEAYVKPKSTAYRPPQMTRPDPPRYQIIPTPLRAPSRAGPIFLMLLSGLGGLAFGLVSLIGIFTTMTGNISAAGGIFGFFMPMTTLCGVVFACSAAASGRSQRIRRYLSEIGAAKLCELSKLAERIQLPLRKIQKDFVWLIRSGRAKGVYLDEQRTCLILDQETYQQYLELKKNAQLRSQHSPQSLPENADEQAGELVQEGKSYIQRIREANDALPGAQISQKLDRLEQIAAEIFRHVGEHPDKQPEVRRMVQYHLPTTLKLVDTYRQLEARTVQGENITSIKQEILKSLDMVNNAFERLLDDLYEDVAMDVSSDISVLNAMLTQEGLAGGDDFKPDSKSNL